MSHVQSACDNLRKETEKIKLDLMCLTYEVLDLINYIVAKDTPELEKEDKGEQIANAMLAFRHLEDAKMRLGKVIQATVGQSVYDK